MMLLLLKHVRRDPRIDFLQWWFEGAACVAGPKTFTLMCIMVQSRTYTGPRSITRAADQGFWFADGT